MTTTPDTIDADEIPGLPMPVAVRPTGGEVGAALPPEQIMPKVMRNGQGRHLYKHGLARTPTHKIWCKIHERCTNPNAINYERYGGRGITMCERWRVFENFLADMGQRPPGMTIERNENSKGYEPGNCRWATKIEQANNKRNNVMVDFQGKTQSVAAWCRELGLNYPLTRQRIYRDKWTPERAFKI